MKKTYIIPATQIVSTLTMTMIAESQTMLKSDTEITSDGDILSKEENFWGDEEW